MVGIGVDVGGTSTKLGLFTEEGNLLRKWQIPTDQRNRSERVIPNIAASIRTVLKEEGYHLSDVTGVGMGVPGPVQPSGYVEICVNLHWRDRYPARELSELLDGVRVELGNDANVAALGEAWKGGGEGTKNAVLITLGTGVGGGIILDGKIVTGIHGLGGEIGHLHVYEGETEACNCGAYGCLEQVASATGIVRVAKRRLRKDQAPSSMRELGETLSAKDVCELGKAGDRLADEVMEQVGNYLGLAVFLLCLTVDPEIFIIGGGVSKAGAYLVEKIKKHYDRYTAISSNRGQIVLATLGNDAGIYGAVKLVL